MDRRVRKSKEALKSALLELLRKKSLHEIQIKQLCEKADVNRSTFYSNYSTVSDVLRDLYQDAIHTITSHVITLTLEGESAKEKFYDAIYQVVCYLQENDAYFSLLFARSGDIRFEEMLYRHYMNSYNLGNLSTQEKYQFLYQIIGGFSIIRAWMTEGYTISAHDVTKLLTGMVHLDKNTFPVTLVSK